MAGTANYEPASLPPLFTAVQVCTSAIPPCVDGREINCGTLAPSSLVPRPSFRSRCSKLSSPTTRNLGTISSETESRSERRNFCDIYFRESADVRVRGLSLSCVLRKSLSGLCAQHSAVHRWMEDGRNGPPSFFAGASLSRSHESPSLLT